MTRKIIHTILFLLLIGSFSEKLSAQCNWASHKPYTFFWDSCKSTSGSLNAYIVFKDTTFNKNCLKYQWTVDSVNAGTGYILNAQISKNGTYKVCLKVTDTCNNCDTTICTTRTISCISSCNWKSKYPYVSFRDTCTGSADTLMAYLTFNSKTSCFKYSASVNGNSVGSFKSLFKYTVTQNGTYIVCLKVIDTCNNCDTSFCYSYKITCISSGNSGCNWNKRKPYTFFWDSCKANANSLNAYIVFKDTTFNQSCLTYAWTVNGNKTSVSGNIFKYGIQQNGNYTVCVKVVDTCSKCDTSICVTRNISCISNSNTCNWKNRAANTYFGDTCTGTADTLIAYVAFKSNTGCYRYEWKVNGTAVTGNKNILKYTVKQNGTYSICVRVVDTCDNCDTTYCGSRTVSCISNSSSGCNWSKRKPYSYFWDSCKTNANSLNAYIVFKDTTFNKNCLVYKWTVNGNKTSIGGNIFKYGIQQNGNYTVCIYITDTCSKCDTVICSTRNISCITSSNTCNWKSRNPSTTFYDTCTGAADTLLAYVAFKSNTGCYRYEWTVNGNAVNGKQNILKYTVKQNGTYNICVKVIDTCNNCDTTYCGSRKVSCISNTSSGCNWQQRKPYSYFWDSCKTNSNSLNAYLVFKDSLFNKNCLKFSWYVNGIKTNATGNIFKYGITQNGTYIICAKVVDTCSKCDTSICATRVITCISAGNTGCNWKDKGLNVYMKDTCTSSAYINGYVSMNKYNACIKYQWTVDGNYAGNGIQFYYNVNQNGQYKVCLRLIDTCTNCDTVICSTRNITCMSGNTPCNWSSRKPYSYYWDSCKTSSGALNAYLIFKDSTFDKKCLIYQWSVNGNKAGDGIVMKYPFNQNGYYNICLRVTDTCNDCDTTFCTIRKITCIQGCNWTYHTPYATYWDSCTNQGATISGYISFKNAGCFKYQWKVDSTYAGTGNQVNYRVTQNGSYKICVKVTDTCNNCDTVICYTVNISCINGISNHGLDNSIIKVYPNPSKGDLQIEWNTSQANYMLYNMSGQAVLSGQLKNGNQNLDITSLPSGVYFIRIQTETSNFAGKIVLQKD